MAWHRKNPPGGRRDCSLIACLFVVLLLQVAPPAFGADDKLQDAWTDASRSLADEAMARFKDVPADSPDAREATYGQAVALLNMQPMTRANIDKSAQFFQSVAGANSADDLGICARYFLGRIEQIYRFEPDPAKAMETYRMLFHDHPEHPVAQRAFVKLVMLDLFDKIPDAERATHFAEFEKTGATLSDHDAVRDFHILMATACTRFGFGEEKRLQHLLAADAAGVVKTDTKASLLVSIAEASRKVGRREMALQYYRKFLADCVGDYRTYTVEQRVATLEKAPQ